MHTTMAIVAYGLLVHVHSETKYYYLTAIFLQTCIF